MSGGPPPRAEPVLTGGGALGEVPSLRPHPGPAQFGRRAERLAALAPGHAAGDYLAFLAQVAEGQRAAAARLWQAPTAAPLARQEGAAQGRPLDAAGPPDPAWRDALRDLLAGLAATPLPGPARATCERLAALAPEALDRLAGRVLSGQLGAGDVAAAPLVGAGLQVAFAVRAARLPAGAVPRTLEEGCPACGFPPVVGLVLGDDKLRYLCCGLCGTQWHHTRVQCTRCRSGARISYLVLEGSDGAAKAEQCEACHAYLKLLYQEKAPGLDPVADDLATLALDLLLAERGVERLGVNLLLAAGDPSAAA